MFNTPNIVGLIKAAGMPFPYSPGAIGVRMAQQPKPVDSSAPAGKVTPSSAGTGLSPEILSAARGNELTLGGAMPTFGSNIDTSVQGSIPSPEEHRAAQIAAGLDENGMPISLDSPEAMAESDALLRQIQADNAASTATLPNAGATARAGNAMMMGGRTSRTSAPASPAAPNPHAFRNISAADMRKFRRYTGASNMNSEMDKWKTWQAMQGNRNASNADFYAARAKGFR